MEILDLIKSTILPIIDVILVAIMLYYAYKLVRGTAAIIVFRGFVIIYIIWWITDLLNMNILSSILGGFIGVGVFAIIIVFQQELRKFLLLLGSSLHPSQFHNQMTSRSQLKHPVGTRGLQVHRHQLLS